MTAARNVLAVISPLVGGGIDGAGLAALLPERTHVDRRTAAFGRAVVHAGRRRPSPEAEAESGAARPEPLGEPLRTAASVLLHAPCTDGTRHRAAVGAARDCRSTP
ncbi:hypothetical protein ACWCPI_08030 [Streptomyces sp. NPDC001920]